MRIDSRLVFGIVCGIEHLAYVMIQGPSAHELALGADFVGYLRGKVSHLNGMLECSRCHLAHPSQQRIIGIG